MRTFDFYRLRFSFEVLQPLAFPPGQSGNLVRGALGRLLRQTANAEVYRDLFEAGGPAAPGPSGLRSRPRPFVIRCTHLDGVAFSPGGSFFIDVHLFELRRPVLLSCLTSAFEQLQEPGPGPLSGGARLIDCLQLDLGGMPASKSVSLALEPLPAPIPRVTLRFATPTELKKAGEVAEEPDFSVLFARLRDRVAILSSLYGHGPLDVDFTGLGARAAAIRWTRSDLTWEHASRRSGATGHIHPLGGFTGEVEYEGELAEFLPWLLAARWCGVGRQTVWGKGEVHVLEPSIPNA